MKWRNIALSLVALTIIFFSLVFYLLRAKAAGGYYGNTDFYKFYQSVLFYYAGQNIYDPSILKYSIDAINKWVTSDGNLNPPFLTFMMLPLHQWPYAKALQLWIQASLILNIMSIALILREFPAICQPVWKPLMVIAAFLLYMPNSGNLAYGQLSSPLLLLTTLTWLAAKHKRDSLAGIALGLAAGMKIFYGLLFIYFLISRRFRLFIVASITYGITLATGWWFFGVHSYLKYYQILKSVRWYTASWNPSIVGFFSRLFSANEKNIPLINLPHVVIPLTVICCTTLSVFLLIAWWQLQKPTTLPQHSIDHFDLGFSMALIAMLLLSPLGWLYYFPILVIPYLILARHSASYQKGYVIHLLACVALFISTLTGNLLVTIDVKTPRQIILNSGFPIYSLLLLLGLFIYLYRDQLRPTVLPTQENPIISENFWLLIYAVMFAPSLMSVMQITRNLLLAQF
jgi:alpha-1,2-mannosyltransferase